MINSCIVLGKYIHTHTHTVFQIVRFFFFFLNTLSCVLAFKNQLQYQLCYLYLIRKMTQLRKCSEWQASTGLPKQHCPVQWSWCNHVFIYSPQMHNTNIHSRPSEQAIYYFYRSNLKGDYLKKYPKTKMKR